MNCCDNCANHGKTERLEWCSCVDLPRNNGVGCLSWKGKTNYDRIISKSPDELAEFIAGIADCGECEAFHGFRMCDAAPEKTCEQCWCGWLTQEAKDGTQN